MRNTNERKRISVAIYICVVLFMFLSCPGFAANPEKVKIGFLLAATGPLSTYGIPMKDAMEWAIKDINSRGGFKVNDKTYLLEGIIYDHASKMEIEAPLMIKKALYTDKVSLFMIDLSLAAKMAISALAETQTPGIILLSPALGPSGPAMSPFTFRLRPEAEQYTPPIVFTIVKDLKAKRISFISSDREDMKDVHVIWKRWTEKLGGNFISENWYAAERQVQDFYPILAEIKSRKPDAVFITGSTNDNAIVYKQAFEVGLKSSVRFLGGTMGMTPEQAKNLIGANYNEVMDNVYGCRGLDPNVHPDKKVREWFATFKQKFGYTPVDLTMWAWDSPFLAIQAFKNAGSVTDRNKIMKAFTELSLPIPGCLTPYSGIGKEKRLFDEDRQAYSVTVAVQWDKGKKDWNTLKYYTVIKGAVTEIDAPK